MIIEEIVEWIQIQLYWQQLIASEIFNGKRCTDEVIQNIYGVFKSENGLDDTKITKNDLDFSNQIFKSTVYDDLKWKGVSNIQGVNALKSDEVLEVGPNMTLVYGNNGSGKSGYSRLFNNVFVSRGDTNILPNIYDKSKAKFSINADFEFADKSGRTITLSYPRDKNNTVFKDVNVFDSVSAISDLSNENELAFLPTEFIFFSRFLDYYSKISELIKMDVKSRTIQNNFGDYFIEDTYVKQLVSQITLSTKMETLEAISKISDDEQKSFGKLMKRKAELLSDDIEEKVKKYAQYQNDIEQLMHRINILNNKFSVNKITKVKELIGKRNKLKELSLQEGINQLSNDEIYNLGSDEWKNFILAAKKYYTIINVEIKNCIFCGQNIEQIEVIDKYWKYLNSEAEKELIQVEKDITSLCSDFSNSTFDLLIKNSDLYNYIIRVQPDLCEKINIFEQQLQKNNSILIYNLTNFTWKDTFIECVFNLNDFVDLNEILTKEKSKLNLNEVRREISKIN